MKDDALSIYDVLRLIVNKMTWHDESEVRRINEALLQAERNQLFGTEGMMQL